MVIPIWYLKSDTNWDTNYKGNILGNVEAACAQAKRYMESATCASTSKNEMAIAILNSDIYSRLRHDTNHHSSSSSSSSSSSEETLGFSF